MKPTVLLLALTLAASAQTKQERGKRVVQDAVEALGGEHFLTLRDVTEQGRVYSFYDEQLSGLSVATVYTRYYDPLGGTPKVGELNVRQRQTYGKNADWYLLFTDTEGYEVTYRGAKQVDPDRFERYKTSMSLDILYLLRSRLKEPGLLFEYEGPDILDNLPVNIVNIIDSENETLTVYFEQASKLPVKTRYYRRDPTTRQRFEEVTVYARYREVDGIQWPYVLTRYRDGERVFQLFCQDVAVNSDLSEGLFVLPTGLKMLKDK
jgi:hypothetical protein